VALVKRVAFPATLAAVLLSSSVPSGVAKIYTKPTWSTGWFLQGGWKPDHQSFESGMELRSAVTPSQHPGFASSPM